MVRCSPSGHLIRSPFLENILASCSGRAAGRKNPGSVSDKKIQESHITTKLAKLVDQDRGHTLINFLKPLGNRSIEIDQTVQSTFMSAAYLMENYILKFSVALGLGFIQIP